MMVEKPLTGVPCKISKQSALVITLHLIVISAYGFKHPLPQWHVQSVALSKFLSVHHTLAQYARPIIFVVIHFLEFQMMTVTPIPIRVIKVWTP